MPWELFWTILAQVLIAQVLLGLPTAIVILIIRGAWTLGSGADRQNRRIL